jgi:hypothetical protein
MKTLFAFVTAILITCNAIVWTEYSIICLTKTHSATVAHPKFAKAHKYHGILCSEWNEERQEYGFFRDGKWCPLFGHKNKP